MRIIIVAALITTLFAGCFGVPEGHAAMGDEVTLNWTAFDLHSGEEVASGNALKFVVGSGTSGLGRDFERHVIGMGVNETASFESKSDPTRPYGNIITTSRFQLEPYAEEQTATVAQFVGGIGQDPVVGLQFDLSFFPAVVTKVDNQTVHYKVLPENGQRDEIAFVGIVLVTTVKDGMVHQVLDADPGVTFTVAPPSQFNPRPPLEGLVPGNYRTRGMNATHILFDHTNQANVDGLALPLRFEVTVTAVKAAAPVEFKEDGFAARKSPVLLADPIALKAVIDSQQTSDAPAMETESAEDDGHGHTH